MGTKDATNGGGAGPPLGRILLSAGYFWLVMVVYYILKPVRDSLFLGESGIRDLPLAHLLNLAATLLFVQGYVALSRRLDRKHFVVGVNLFFIVGLVFFWLILGPFEVSPAARKVLAWAYFVFVSAFSVFGVSMLWSLTHATFSPEEGKHWYGWIGSGGTLGALSGGFITSTLARQVGTMNLLLIALLGFLPCMALGWALGRRADEIDAAGKPSTPSPPSEQGSRPPEEPEEPKPSAWRMLLDNPYLGMIALLIFAKLFVGLTQDYQAQEFIARSFPGDRDGRTQFFGSIYQWTNVLGLFLGTVVTGPLQMRWGAFPGLATYPLATFLGGVGLLLWPGLTTVFWWAVASQACAYSIFQWSQELLYQRTTREEKFVAKGFIDTFVFRLGTGAAAVTILTIGKLGDHGWFQASNVVMAGLMLSCAILFVLSWRLGKRFLQLGDAASGSGSR